MSEWENANDFTKSRIREEACLILANLYWCGRVWEAWNYGTMSQSDFISADEDDDIVENTAIRLFNLLTKHKSGAGESIICD